jgi:hypothetical protein
MKGLRDTCMDFFKDESLKKDDNDYLLIKAHINLAFFKLLEVFYKNKIHIQIKI